MFLCPLKQSYWKGSYDAPFEWLSKRDLLEIVRALLDENKGGQMRTMLGIAALAMLITNCRAAQRSKTLDEFFETHDKNKDGFLSLKDCNLLSQFPLQHPSMKKHFSYEKGYFS